MLQTFDKQAVRIKLYVNRKEGGKYNPTNHDVDYFIELRSHRKPFLHPKRRSLTEVELFKDHYIYANLLSTLKSNAKTINVLGSIYATENGYQNCLLLNEKKMVSRSATRQFIFSQRHYHYYPSNQRWLFARNY